MGVAGPAKPDHTKTNSDSIFDDLTRKRAWDLVGGLSNTSKMPCSSWGLSPKHCVTGAKLTAIPGSVCHDCYARKGYYCYPRVREAHERRLAGSDDPQWVEAMRLLIDDQAIRREPYFRWFDSGDVQSVNMLDRIAEVARATPAVQHWLPTKEHDLVTHYLARYELPENLTVRLSAHRIDEPAPDHGLPTSTVHKDKLPIGIACPAYENQPATCGDCRSCWNPTVRNVSYRHH